MKNVLLIIFSMGLAVFGHILLKKGMMRVGHIDLSPADIPSALFNALSSPIILFGLGLFFISALVWLIVLSRVDLSFAYPMVAMGYVLTQFLSWYLFKEDVSILRLSGCITICIGVILISKS